MASSPYSTAYFLPLDLLSAVPSNLHVSSAELRASVSTDASEGPDGRHKVWRCIKSVSSLHLYKPLSPTAANALRTLSAGLEQVLERLEGELGSFSLSECMHRSRECQLANVPTGSSLLRRRGLVLTVSRT